MQIWLQACQKDIKITNDVQMEFHTTKSSYTRFKKNPFDYPLRLDNSWKYLVAWAAWQKAEELYFIFGVTANDSNENPFMFNVHAYAPLSEKKRKHCNLVRSVRIHSVYTF